jgi:hypothetical protein
VTDCLRQNDQAVFLPVREAQRIGGLVLSPGNSLQAAANDFGKIGAGVEPGFTTDLSRRRNLA